METVIWCAAAAVVGVVVGYLAGVVRGAQRTHAAQLGQTRAEAELAAERRGAGARIQAMEHDQDRLSDQFRALAAEALASNNEQFLGLAEQRLRSTQVAGQADLASRTQAVQALVDPLARTLTDVRQQMAAAEESRIASSAALGEQVRGMRDASELLRQQTSSLVNALRTSDIRGAWGEVQLRRVVEVAGMLNRVDFVEQSHVTTDDGALRPDMVVHLAGGKNIVVDAKVAFLGYLDAQQATDPAVRARRLSDHARHVRKHIDDLAGKRYWDQFSPTPEFVVMFIPAEPLLSAAVEEDPGLLEYAFGRNVVIVTPMTLMALLRTVSYAWRQEALAENAQKVLEVGKELHQRLGVLSKHLADLGSRISSTAGAYNKAVASFESRVLVSARRFNELDIVDGDLPQPPAVAPQLSVVSWEADDELEALDGASPLDAEADEEPVRARH